MYNRKSHADFILLIAALLFISNSGISTHDLVRHKVRSEMSRWVGGEVDYQQVNLSFFPIPKVMLSNFKIIIPRKISASAETIDLYPGYVITAH